MYSFQTCYMKVEGVTYTISTNEWEFEGKLKFSVPMSNFTGTIAEVLSLSLCFRPWSL